MTTPTDLEKLREEIAEIVRTYDPWHINAEEITDRILALPQIADLLRMKAIQVQR